MFSQICIGMAIIGFGFGMAVGSKLSPHDRNAPASSGIVGAVLFYLAADFLITSVVLALIGLTLYFAIRAWPTVHESLLTFARESGMRVKATREQPSIAERIEAMRHEFESRVASLRNLGLTTEDEEECVEMAGSKLRENAKQLADTDYSTEI